MSQGCHCEEKFSKIYISFVLIPNVWMTSFCHLSSFEKRLVTLGPCPEIPRSVPNQNSRLVVVAVSWPASCVCKFLPCLWVKVVSMFRLGGAPEPNADCTSIKALPAITEGTAASTLDPGAQLFHIKDRHALHGMWARSDV